MGAKISVRWVSTFSFFLAFFMNIYLNFIVHAIFLFLYHPPYFSYLRLLEWPRIHKRLHVVALTVLDNSGGHRNARLDEFFLGFFAERLNHENL